MQFNLCTFNLFIIIMMVSLSLNLKPHLNSGSTSTVYYSYQALTLKAKGRALLD